MKIKSFTLIEVMIASYIFMIVIMMVTSSFAMIRKSNENSDDFRVTSSCSRQVEDVVKSAVKSASFGNPIMKLIVEVGVDYKLYDSATKPSGQVVGFATFEDPNIVTDSSMVRIKTFAKRPNTAVTPKNNSYYYAVGNISLKTATGNPGANPRVEIPDGLVVSGIMSGPQRINSADCSANDSGQPNDFFYIYRVSGYGARSSVYTYSLEIQDKFFRSFADRATEAKYSDLNLFVSNDAKNF